ncbi:MAG: PD-(D/E)XK nuclease family protein [Actinomycetia bacterium]|nr:PD-(D/E)XK nuclease family protein [Actinomycetes bacterium]
MALPVPTTLTPSKISTYTDCALAFRFSAIDRVPEPPSRAATRGTLVHGALEHLLQLPAHERTPQAGPACVEAALADLNDDPDLTGLGLDDAGLEALRTEALDLVAKYFELEDPRSVNPIGLELRLEFELDGVTLRGIIDRLELDENGDLIVTDYKTGRAPPQQFENQRLGGVHFYALLCEQVFGRRPARIQLLHLADPVAIVATPSEQSSRGLARKVSAIWKAVERSCGAEDFRPRPGRLCDWCGFRTWCPAHGGDPEAAPRRELSP